MTNDELSKPKLRAIQYWYEDGTFEFSFGGLCLLLAGYFYAYHRMGNSWVSDLLSMAFVLVVIGGAFIINRIVMALKERVTFPRTGYIAFKRRTPVSRIARAIVVGSVAAAITGTMTLFFFNRPMFMSWIPAVSGFIFGCVMIFVAWRTEIVRFYGIAALSLIAGVIVSTLGLSNNHGLAIYYGVIGISLLVEGLVVLALYLCANPAPAKEHGQ